MSNNDLSGGSGKSTLKQKNSNDQKHIRTKLVNSNMGKNNINLLYKMKNINQENGNQSELPQNMIEQLLEQMQQQKQLIEQLQQQNKELAAKQGVTKTVTPTQNQKEDDKSNGKPNTRQLEQKHRNKSRKVDQHKMITINLKNFPKTIEEMQNYKIDALPQKQEIRDWKIRELEVNLKKEKKYIRKFKVNVRGLFDPLIMFKKVEDQIKEKLAEITISMRGIKVTLAYKGRMMKQKPEGDEFETVYFESIPPQIIMTVDEVDDAFDAMKERIMDKIDEFTSIGSGWLLDGIDGLFINIWYYDPISGGTYCELPKELQNSAKGLINLKNEDNECFRWCHIRHLNPQAKDGQRIKKSDRKMVDQLDYSGIQFPVQIKDIPKIEKQNQINVNVFGYENKKLFPIYLTKTSFEKEMDLLLISGENSHYVLITDLSKLTFSLKKNKMKKIPCKRCLQLFRTKEKLEKHQETCIAVNGDQAIKMPEANGKDNIIEFTKWIRQVPVPFTIYLDTESVLKKTDQDDTNEEGSYTRETEKHRTSGIAYKLICFCDDKYSKPLVVYRGKDAIKVLLKRLQEDVRYCLNMTKMLSDKFKNKANRSDEGFEETDGCIICDGKFDGQNKKTYYCQFTGVAKGSAHEKCNKNVFIEPNKLKIPVLCHNLRGYDSHFIMQEIGDFIVENKYLNQKGKDVSMNLNVIANNQEKYMAIMLGNHLEFKDSFQFMASSLERLVGNLNKEDFVYMRQHFKDNCELLARKGVYPYEYIDSSKRFKEKRLPTKEAFYSSVTDEGISDDEYKHAQNVWKTCGIKTLGGYHDLYLATDVLLLADVFEKFRKLSMKIYKLDPCWFFTSPGLAWDAMLKMTGIRLELMTDIDMYLFIEKGTRGGISYIANRYGKANNKYMSDYKPDCPISYLMYLDANNLYGWGMSQYLPTGGFKWMTDKKMAKFNLNDYKDNSKMGCMLEVDLEYPQELHDLHNDYPMAPEKMVVKPEMLSNYCKKIAGKLKLNTDEKTAKLIPTLWNKSKYVIHYRLLQQCLKHGLKLTKIHRILTFRQQPFLKKYIDFNTQMRTNAKNAFEKDFFKLMNNSVYGKTMENLRNRVDIRLITDLEKLAKLVAKPTFNTSKKIGNNLHSVFMRNEVITLNKPAYLGMSILDLSKVLMYEFHYGTIKKMYGDKAKLLFTDTDSLFYQIEAEDVYSDFWKIKEKFDNSDYDKDSPFWDATNKKVIGKFKDEAAGVPIKEFVGLRSKMYSYIKDNGSNGKTAKGIKKIVIKKEIQHSNYKEVLLENRQMHHKMKTFRSINHQVSTYEIQKVSLSCYDNKRYILDDGATTRAYGHYKNE